MAEPIKISIVLDDNNIEDKVNSIRSALKGITEIPDAEFEIDILLNDKGLRDGQQKVIRGERTWFAKRKKLEENFNKKLETDRERLNKFFNELKYKEAKVDGQVFSERLKQLRRQQRIARSIGQKGQASFIGSDIKSEIRQIRGLRRAIKDIAKDKRALGQISREAFAKKVYTEAAQGVNVFRKVFSATITKLAIGAGLVEGFKALTGGLSGFIQQGAEFEQLSIGLEAFSKNQETANFLLREFTNIAVKSPFDLQQVATAGKTLLAFGLTTEEAIESLKLLARGAGATGSDLGLLARNLGQTKAQGRAFTRDIQQFGSAGLAVLPELANVLGESAEKVQELVTAGKVGFPAVLQVLRNILGDTSKFAEISNRQLNTLSGTVGNLQTKVFELAGAVNSTLGPIINPLLKGITAGVGFLAERTGALIPLLKVLAGGFILLAAKTVKTAGALKVLTKLLSIPKFFGISKSLTVIAKEFEFIDKTAKGAGRSIFKIFGDGKFKTSLTTISLAFKQLGVSIVKTVGYTILATVAFERLGQLILAYFPDNKISDIATELNSLKTAVQEFRNAAEGDVVDPLDGVQKNLRESAARLLKISGDQLAELNRQFLDGKLTLSEYNKELLKASSPGSILLKLPGFVAGYLQLWGKTVAAIKQNVNVVAYQKKLEEGLASDRAREDQLKRQADLIEDNFSLSREEANIAAKGKAETLKDLNAQKLLQKEVEQRLPELQRINKLSKGTNSANQQELRTALLTLNAAKERQKILSRTLGTFDRILFVAKETGQAIGGPEGIRSFEQIGKEVDEIAKKYNKLQGVITGYIQDTIFLQTFKYKEEQNDIQRTLKDVQKRYNKEKREIALARKAINDKYDGEIAKLQKLNVYEKRLEALDLEKLRRKAESGRLSGRALLEAKAEYQRALANQKIRDLEEAKEQEILELNKRQLAVTERFEGTIDNLNTTLERLADIISGTEDGWNRVTSRVRATAIQQKRLEQDAAGYQEYVKDAARQLGTSVDLNQRFGASFRGVAQNARTLSSAQGQVASDAASTAKSYLFIQNAANKSIIASKKFDANGNEIQDSLGSAASSVESLPGDIVIANSRLGDTVSSANGLSAAFQNGVIYIRQIEAASQNISNNLQGIGARQLGGRVSLGKEYLVNEIGTEAFLSDSGSLQLLKDRGYFKPQESGTILPAWLTRQLNIPEGGLNVAPVGSEFLSRANVPVYASRDEAITDAITRINGSNAQQANELGRLTQSIQAMTNKEWEVKLDIHNKAHNSLLSKMRSQY